MTDASGASPGEIGGIMAGTLAVLGTAGAGIRWLAHWINGREEARASRNSRWEADLAARERAIEDKLSASLARCEEHCAAVEAKFNDMRMAMLLVIPELLRVAPYSPALKQARDLLGDSLPIAIELPDRCADVC